MTHATGMVLVETDRRNGEMHRASLQPTKETRSSWTRVCLVAAIAMGIVAMIASTTVQARQRRSTWVPIERSDLTVTQGNISTVGRKATLQTRDPGMRAVAIDGGSHATSARLWFRYLGESTTTVPLGSGAIRRQIGLKLAAADPCNLVYVMWHAYPKKQIQVQVKRNPGETTSAQCENNGYTTLATFSRGDGDGTTDHGPHRLEAHLRRDSSEALALSIVADGETLGPVQLSAAQSAGLDGPVGVRSDNGDYLFRVFAKS